MEEFCCLCRLSISKDSRKRKSFHGTSCIKAKAILANLTTSIASQTNSLCIGSCFGHLFTGYTKGYTCLRTGVEWHQKLSVDSEKFSSQDFLWVRTQVSADDVTRLFFPLPTQKEKMSLAHKTTYFQTTVYHFQHIKNLPKLAACCSAYLYNNGLSLWLSGLLFVVALIFIYTMHCSRVDCGFL